MGIIASFLFAVVVLFVIACYSCFTVVQQYQRAVVFSFGRCTGVRGPGLQFLLPVIHKIFRVDMRTVPLDVPRQDVITRDNISLRVDAVVFFRVVDPVIAITEIENYVRATAQLAQTTLRTVLGHHEMDEILSDRDKIGIDIQRILDEQSTAWGIKIHNVEIKDIDLGDEMIRAMAKQAEAERTRRSKIIAAEGEQQAAQKLLEAANVLAQSRNAMQLRYLQTLSEIAGERSSTIVFPLPMDLLEPLGQLLGKQHREPRVGAAPEGVGRPSVQASETRSSRLEQSSGSAALDDTRAPSPAPRFLDARPHAAAPAQAGHQTPVPAAPFSPQASAPAHVPFVPASSPTYVPGASAPVPNPPAPAQNPSGGWNMYRRG